MKLCISMKDNETVITSDAGMEYEFVYDYSIWSCDPKDPHYVGQEKLYEMMGRPLLNSAFEGYNTCLFAYGQVIHVLTSRNSNPRNSGKESNRVSLCLKLIHLFSIEIKMAI